MTTSWLSKLLLHTICRSVPRPQPPRLTTSIGPCADPDLWAHLGDSTSVSRTLGNQQPAAFSLHSWGEKDTCPITETISPETAHHSQGSFVTGHLAYHLCHRGLNILVTSGFLELGGSQLSQHHLCNNLAPPGPSPSPEHQPNPDS